MWMLVRRVTAVGSPEGETRTGERESSASASELSVNHLCVFRAGFCSSGSLPSILSSVSVVRPLLVSATSRCSTFTSPRHLVHDTLCVFRYGSEQSHQRAAEKRAALSLMVPVKHIWGQFVWQDIMMKMNHFPLQIQSHCSRSQSAAGCMCTCGPVCSVPACVVNLVMSPAVQQLL